jgi:hypothetical protein
MECLAKERGMEGGATSANPLIQKNVDGSNIVSDDHNLQQTCLLLSSLHRLVLQLQ